MSALLTWSRAATSHPQFRVAEHFIWLSFAQTARMPVVQSSDSAVGKLLSYTQTAMLTPDQALWDSYRGIWVSTFHTQ